MRKLSEEKAIILKQEFVEVTAVNVDPASISPGIVPARSGGKKAKYFFSLFKSFIGVTLMGFACEPRMVHQLPCSNPSYVRACGFAQKYTRYEYCHLHIPHPRKLEQFDQIMREYGLWDKIKIDEVRHNLSTGIIKVEQLFGNIPEIQPLIRRVLYDSSLTHVIIKIYLFIDNPVS